MDFGKYGPDVEFRAPPNLRLDDDVWSDDVRDALAPVCGPPRDDGHPPDGVNTVLVTGPVGAGKTYLARAVLGELGVEFGHVRPDVIDDALRRPGRLGKEIHVPPPDEAASAEIFEVHTRDRPVAEAVTVEWLVETADPGLSGAGMAGVCEDGARAAMRCELDDVPPDAADPDAVDVRIRRRDFERAFEGIDAGERTADPAAFQ